MKKFCALHQPLSLPIRLVLAIGIGSALAATNGPAVGFAVGLGLFLSLLANRS